ncbi:MFS transporter, partial [Corynebacterium felinum]
LKTTNQRAKVNQPTPQTHHPNPPPPNPPHEKSGLGMYAFSPLVGLLNIRVGFAKSVCLGGGIMIFSVVLLAFFHAIFVLFVIGLFGVGLAWSVGMIASSAAVSQVADSVQRVKVQGRLDVCINVAAGVTSLCSGLVTGVVGYPALAVSFLAVSILIAVATLVASRYQLKYSHKE